MVSWLLERLPWPSLLHLSRTRDDARTGPCLANTDVRLKVLLNIPGLPPAATFVGVTTSTFDGKGNLTGTEHVVVNGSPFNAGFTTNAGTYSVNPDCTGTAMVNTPNSPVPLKSVLRDCR